MSPEEQEHQKEWREAAARQSRYLSGPRYQEQLVKLAEMLDETPEQIDQAITSAQKTNLLGTPKYEILNTWLCCMEALAAQEDTCAHHLAALPDNTKKLDARGKKVYLILPNEERDIFSDACEVSTVVQGWCLNMFVSDPRQARKLFLAMLDVNSVFLD